MVTFLLKQLQTLFLKFQIWGGGTHKNISINHKHESESEPSHISCVPALPEVHNALELILGQILLLNNMKHKAINMVIVQAIDTF